MKADVMFLWSAIDTPDIIESLPITDGIDTVIYAPGALLWSIPRNLQTKSKMVKLVGTKLYTQITVRNVNTVRKLAMKIKA